MRNLKYILLGFCAFFLSACEDFLVEKPLSDLNKEVMFSSIENAESAILGVYYDVSLPWAKSYPYFGNYATDEAVATWSGTTAYFSGFKGAYTSGSKDVYNLWKQSYKAIVDANACVENIPNIAAASDDQKNKLVGEAKFLRAFTYFDLIQLFGPVPLYLKETDGYSEDLFVGRTPVSEIMDQIISDAEFAYEHLPASDSDLGGRASKWAAAMLLAKVHMLRAGHFIDAIDGKTPDPYFANGDVARMKSDYEKAAGYLLDIDQNSWHSLVSVSDNNSSREYGNIFLKSSRASVANEILFDIQYNGPTRSSDWGKRSISGANQYYPELGFYYLWGQGNAASSFSLSYDDRDIRFNWNIIPYSVKRNGGDINRIAASVNFWVHAKFRTENSTNSQGALVYRYADVVLMLAEVINELAEGPNSQYNVTMPDGSTVASRSAYEYINQIRDRARIPQIDDDYLDATNPAEEHPAGMPGTGGDDNSLALDDYGWIYRANILSDYSYEGVSYYTERHVYYNKKSNDRSGQYKELFQEALQMERAWELCFERHRWFDLKRWNIWYERVSTIRDAYGKLTDLSDPIDKSKLPLINFSAAYKVKLLKEDIHQYVPIPQSEMMVNPQLTPNNNGY